MSVLVHLIGPGGAGKTTVGAIVAARLNWRFVDVDQCFLAAHGNIADFIRDRGYAGYASHNVRLYERLKRGMSAPTICAMSSGFMLYPDDVAPAYRALRRGIEEDGFTALLLPSFDLERCAKLVVGRQMSRPYLNANEVDEMRKIRDRFPAFMRLNCRRFESDGPPEQVAADIERFIMASIPSGEHDPHPVAGGRPTHPCCTQHGTGNRESDIQ
ncbi:shikimate kinase [Burkholderia lata]|uniref:Shikimate kinase 2 n=1 Tax=Burkholderia lata (strain ATCC 17760 / DSM 23089 / LMG 22485 / NCIMB 9086 / R18194 / 383) TaxID=482957 RepID=A0A6P2PSV5_BURL3|nr:shikimate kinase [Burkholderia lata]VWC10047.1 Shikimate kinase 2 [Burkholderia lata]